MRIDQLLRKEALLDRRQRHCSYCLIRFSLFRLGRVGNLGELRDGLVLKHLLELELRSMLSHARDDLNADDRIAAQLEEVVVNAYSLESQDVLPHLDQRRFYFVTRSF